jgi:NAD(P)-dependent dehydrogenase (short-subunit alcohol dehydrogenase family)
MPGAVEGKVAVVTGAASGIGRASACALAREGARVVVSDVDEAGGAETVGLIAAAGDEAIFVAADVADEADVRRLIDATVERYGRLDCAHNNAGVAGALAPTADYPREAWDRILAVNLTGTWLCMKHEIPRMLDHGAGAIVNTSSTFGLAGVPGIPGYVATKHAIAGLTKAAALEYAQQGIRVNAVCPGVIQTPLLDRFLDEISGGHPEVAAAQFVAGEPVGRMGDPAEIAEAVVWLCSDAASFVTGLPMPVDGGWLAQ